MFKQVRVILLENFSLMDLAWREFEKQVPGPTENDVRPNVTMLHVFVFAGCPTTEHKRDVIDLWLVDRDDVSDFAFPATQFPPGRYRNTVHASRVQAEGIDPAVAASDE